MDRQDVHGFYGTPDTTERTASIASTADTLLSSSVHTGSTTILVPCPPPIEDNTVISVTLPAAVLEGPDPTATTNTNASSGTPSDPDDPPPRHPSVFAKLTHKKGAETRIVLMTRSDYLRYWARDVEGNYIGTAPESDGPRIWREKHKQIGEGDRPTSADVKSSGAELRFGRVTGATLEPQEYNSGVCAAGFELGKLERKGWERK